MKIAIHHRKGSFSERWIEYCTEKDIPFKIVNAYDSDIVKQVEDCDVFMWIIFKITIKMRYSRSNCFIH